MSLCECAAGDVDPIWLSRALFHSRCFSPKKRTASLNWAPLFSRECCSKFPELLKRSMDWVGDPSLICVCVMRPLELPGDGPLSVSRVPAQLGESAAYFWIKNPEPMRFAQNTLLFYTRAQNNSVGRSL